MGKQITQKCLSELELTTAYVLLSVNQGSEKKVIDTAKSFGSVKEAYVCFGLYDLILKVEVDSMEDLKALLICNYKKIKNVKTLLILLIENKKDALFLEPLINVANI